MQLARGRYRARLADCPADLAAARTLRARVFASDRADAPDPYDAASVHVLIETMRDDTPVCNFRLMPLAAGRLIEQSYSAQYYGLDKLRAYPGRMVEMGRFCIHPDWRDPDILRLAWGALTQIVDRDRVELLFGCASFQGTDAQAHADAFAMLHDRHIAPPRWLPRVKARHVVQLARALTRPLDRRRAMATMPPLLRTYLSMGGWVSDHAVVDADMGTMHVFTGVEIGAIPAARARLLRMVAG